MVDEMVRAGNDRRGPQLHHIDVRWPCFWERVKHESDLGKEPGKTIWERVKRKELEKGREKVREVVEGMTNIDLGLGADVKASFGNIQTWGCAY